MLSIHCPECELRLLLEEGEPTDRLDCPGCGTIFQWDRATGLVTIFFDPAGVTPTDAGEVNEPEDDANDTAGETVSPEEAIARISRKWEDKLEEENRRRKRRFAGPFLITTLLFLVCGGFGAAANWERWWVSLIVIVPLALLIGFAVAGFLTGAADLGRDLHRFVRKIIGEGAREPDLDDIAERLRRGIVRRQPLPSSSDSSENRGENEAGRCPNITPECAPPVDKQSAPLDRSGGADAIRRPSEPPS